ncbi:MAG: hypothetical protein ACTSQF_04465 [Candidatus Heimdallarchaeaceae archaeon]
MNMDQGYYDLSSFKQTRDNSLKLDNLPNDYFYSTEYEYMTLPEVQLLLTLSDSNISYSFSGLRKTTDLHQHQLTKALKRLQDRKYLSKNDLGTYELTYSGSRYTKSLIKDLLSAKALNIQNNDYNSQWKKIKTIPPLEQEIISSILEKRWFGNFRFLYKREIKSFIQLCWEDSENNQVRLFIHKDGSIDVEYRENQSTGSSIETVANWVSNELLNLDDVSIDVFEDEIVAHIDETTYN